MSHDLEHFCVHGAPTDAAPTVNQIAAVEGAPAAGGSAPGVASAELVAALTSEDSGPHT
jgi:hypothetical protein